MNWNQLAGVNPMLRPNIPHRGARQARPKKAAVKRRSKAFRIMTLVIEDGVAALDDTQRKVYDQVLVPQIEQLSRRRQLRLARGFAAARNFVPSDTRFGDARCTSLLELSSGAAICSTDHRQAPQRAP